LLGAAFLLVMTAAQRQRRLARQSDGCSSVGVAELLNAAGGSTVQRVENLADCSSPTVRK